MRKSLYLSLIGIVIIIVSVNGQNRINFIDSYYWLGLGQPTVDRDTLYLSVLNGHGIERYYIADPQNPVYLDRAAAYGFELIDFEDKLLLERDHFSIRILDFSDFARPQLL